MTAKLPTYCPLGIDFDAARLHQELVGLRSRFESIPTTRAMIERRTEWFALGEDDLYDQVDQVVAGPQGKSARIMVQGRVPSWTGMGLTHVPEAPETDLGGSRFRRGFDGRWRWKDEPGIRYARQLVESLGFRRIDNVRVMRLQAGGFGPAHVDWASDEPWEREGLASITFLLRDGGVPMRFMTSAGLHDVRDPVFFFKDCAPHGVPRTGSDRLLLRVNGAMSRRRLRSMMLDERAIA